MDIKTLLHHVKGQDLAVSIKLENYKSSLGTTCLFVEDGFLGYAGDDQFVICRLDRVRAVTYSTDDYPDSLHIFLELDNYTIGFDAFGLDDPDTFWVHLPKMKRILTGHEARALMNERALAKPAVDVRGFLDPQKAEAYLSNLHDLLVGLSRDIEMMVMEAKLSSREEAISIISAYLGADASSDELEELEDEYGSAIDLIRYSASEDVLEKLASFMALFDSTATSHRE